MSLTRRALVASAAALLATPVLARERAKPIVIGHRGASGERPEHTPMAYRLAVEQGADYIEPDLVITQDGHLVARHENEIGGTTDVADRAEFARRKTTKIIDGAAVEGWFTEDFTLAELKTLRCRERLPQLRPENTRFDGREAIPTFDEVCAIARDTGVGVYPEMKHPRHFASVGLPFERRMADALKANNLDSRDAKVFVQCFEIAPLKAIRGLTKARLVQLIDSEGSPADAPGFAYADMATAAGLKAISAYADGVGPHWSFVVPSDGQRLLPATAFMKNAHAAGLRAHPWTVRAENHFLPTELQRPAAASRPDAPRLHGDVAALFKALYDAGVDGLFSDFPGLAVEARKAWMYA
ncbi:MAG TPA: glycerophosphodiester phosphodiesterase [Caulobacter sp.]|nr:glycerophosphodiester phosphodiesterase [Caulobacter sp.]